MEAVRDWVAAMEGVAKEAVAKDVDETNDEAEEDKGEAEAAMYKYSQRTETGRPSVPKSTLLSCASAAGTVGARVLLARPADRAKTVPFPFRRQDGVRSMEIKLNLLLLHQLELVVL